MYNLRVVEKQPLEIKKKQNQMLKVLSRRSKMPPMEYSKILRKAQKMRLHKSSTANCFILHFCDNSYELRHWHICKPHNISPITWAFHYSHVLFLLSMVRFSNFPWSWWLIPRIVWNEKACMMTDLWMQH